MLLTLGFSSNSGRVPVEGSRVSHFDFLDLTEPLIGRIGGGECALTPHRGNRRRVPTSPVPLELMEFVRFIRPMMSMRLRRGRGTADCGCCCCSGLLGEDVLETVLVPNEGVVDLGGLSEHSF